MVLLYIQPTIYFLIGRKRTVIFRNQRQGPHLASDYTILILRTLEVTGNHVMYDMISRGNHVKLARFVLLADLYIFTRLELNYQFHLLL